MKSIKIYQIIFLFYFLSPFAFAQENVNLKFKHFSSKEGLSQVSVITVFQDKKGYLWFGTRDGLNKYDGTKFVSYRHNSEDSTSLSHSWVTSIFEGAYGNLWIGTKDGLNKYNPKNNSFKRMSDRSYDLSRN